jgi:hypothetical protein
MRIDNAEESRGYQNAEYSGQRDWGGWLVDKPRLYCVRGSTKWRSGEAREERVGAEPNKKERGFDGRDGWME